MEVNAASTRNVATSTFGASSAEASAKVGTLSGKTHAELLTLMGASRPRRSDKAYLKVR